MITKISRNPVIFLALVFFCLSASIASGSETISQPNFEKIRKKLDLNDLDKINLKIDSSKSKYKLGEPIRVQAWLVNKSNKNITVWPPSTALTNFKIIGKEKNKGYGSMTIGTIRNSKENLSPGEKSTKVVHSINYSDLKGPILKPGKYRITFVYQEQVKSEPIKIRIKQGDEYKFKYLKQLRKNEHNPAKFENIASKFFGIYQQSDDWISFKIREAYVQKFLTVDEKSRKVLRLIDETLNTFTNKRQIKTMRSYKERFLKKRQRWFDAAKVASKRDLSKFENLADVGRYLQNYLKIDLDSLDQSGNLVHEKYEKVLRFVKKLNKKYGEHDKFDSLKNLQAKILIKMGRDNEAMQVLNTMAEKERKFLKKYVDPSSNTERAF